MNIPIKAAKELALKYDLDEVVIIARRYDKDHPTTKPSKILTTTYGKTKKSCKFAADAGTQITKIITDFHKRLTRSKS